ncbi:S-adenosylmethionine-dependent nucleotide dehydratase RSAD2-like [Haliotis asinina]|uniref:S-adenosylmethionine-dependent nucleotide dehydratase RSAD2-like n=1 Tax=Haliotis asinina TaxID=109174 RepID=UPI0035324BD6
MTGFLIVIASLYMLRSFIQRFWEWLTGTVNTGRLTDTAGGEPVACSRLNSTLTPVSVNYHFTRRCNYKCGFCFHTAKTSFVLPLDEAKRGLKALRDAGMEKVNFSGGEPFLEDRGHYVGDLVTYCKRDLRLPSVSIVSNGSLIKESWFEKYGEYLDILAVSCDSFDPETNQLIGRQQGGKSHLNSLLRVRDWCYKYKVAFKLNTVVNTYNKDEDMTGYVTALKPCRWKVFQCLVLEGENAGEDALRDAGKFVVSDEVFQDFLSRHKEVPSLVPESNEKMQNSYLILDEYMRFLDCRDGSKRPSKSLLDVGVQQALDFSGFDEKMFLARGGRYKWSKADMRLEW